MSKKSDQKINVNVLLKVLNYLKFDITQYEKSFIELTVKNRFKATEISTFSYYLNYLANNKDEAISFYNSLNITYSDSFRNPVIFACLEKTIPPQTLNNDEEK